MSKIKAIGLFSGGLDSLLATRLLIEQGIEVMPITFDTGFFNVRTTKKNIKKLDEEEGKSGIKNLNLGDGISVPVVTVDVRDAYMPILTKPKFGYGKAYNPCIDCHLFMIHQAKKIMIEQNAHFVYTGEVSGQRPMSQNIQALKKIEAASILDGLLLRPLSAKLLPITKVEENGWVDREKLLDIHGRSRVVQIELAKKFGIDKYQQPAGGCILTDISYGLRLKDLIKHSDSDIPDWQEIDLISGGRIFRPNKKCKIIVGRNESDNDYLLKFNRLYPVIDVENYNGPTALIAGEITQENINIAAGIVISYSKAPKDEKVKLLIKYPDEHTEIIEASAMEKERFFKWKIG